MDDGFIVDFDRQFAAGIEAAWERLIDPTIARRSSLRRTLACSLMRLSLRISTPRS